ncbi:MAG TPA: response regulator [Gammaproteobacteria bacterium]
MSRVLLVDDDDSFRTVLRKHVAPYCKYPFVTGDAALALAAAQAGDADCMVLDLMMPDMDGFTLLTLLRDHSVTSTLPVLACSSKMLSSEEQALLLDLRAPFLPKHALDQGSLASGLIEADTWSRQATREAVRVRAGAA